MQEEKIVITVNKIGEVQVDAQGFQDNGCEAATKHIEIALGGAKKRDEKPEFHVPPTNTAQSIKNMF